MTNDEDRAPLISDQFKSAPNQSGLKLSFFCLVTCVVLFVFVFSYHFDSLHPIVDQISGHFGYHNLTKQYAVIIDAGSTGSRVTAFEFHSGYLDGRLVLDDELFRQLKPGLSSFVNDESKAVKQIEGLIAEAKQFVPREKWNTTPIALKATAGLRLLGQEHSDRLLQVVGKVLLDSGFKTEDETAVIMDGLDEGLFSWFTVNFLTGHLTGGKTVAALDLGGGSTQVTYVMDDEKSVASNKDLIHPVTVLKTNMNVFTNSYLGLGLMASRHAIMTEGKDITAIESDCVNPIIKNRVWNYGNVDYEISGKPNPKSSASKPEVDFDVCYNRVKRYVVPMVQPVPSHLQKQEIAAFSYYYDRAIETGLIDAISGGETTIKNFYLQAREACASPNAEQPFMCLDLTFISVLLEHGFRLRPTTNLKLYKKIDGHETSWALGCAFSIITRGRSSFL